MSLSEAKLLDDVRQRLFAPVKSKTPRAVGVEIELIPIHAATRRPAVPTSAGASSTAAIISRLAKRHGWLEESVENDPPAWELQDGTRISFEPGGQIEISSIPHPTASSVIDSTQALVAVLQVAMATEGIELLARGVDPYNDIDAVPLQLHRDRYQRMTRYFDSIGPSGIRMMRQTAALQINLERGEDPQFRWRLLNGLAPIVVALFANSGDYAGKSTEWASYRSQLWRTLDPSRTGIIYEERGNAEKYLSFALDAFAMHSGSAGQPYRTFRDWMREPDVNEAEWLFHLSTLFPEVRPKEYFELRSADTIEPAQLFAPVVFVTGLVYDDQNAKSANDILGPPDPVLLLRAGSRGLKDRELWRLAVALCELAIEGAARLGEGYISTRHRDEAGVYFKASIRKFQ
ncbi:MAG TPA: glutamate-cysteine ligase family protein [Gemmatimonadaceae bacterium]|nr:glutamate-cysteine ligase family protein [Gemmatimonadaceae bacterium]